MKSWIFFLTLVLNLFSFSWGNAQAGPPPTAELIPLLNGVRGIPLYEAKDISGTSLHPQDFNSDGRKEWVVIPDNACGETRNCSFFILQQGPENHWKLILAAPGKITSLSPWGFIISPRRTQGYADLIVVEDHGPEPDASRSLRRYVYVWDGKQYTRFNGQYPPEGASAELRSLDAKVQGLKHEKFQRVPGRVFQ